MSADTAAPQARYRVLRGIVHHPGGVARPGDIIPLPPQDGDPLCRGPAAVLAQVLDQPAPGIVDVQSTSSAEQPGELIGDGEGWQAGERPDDAPVGEQIDGQGLEPIEPEPVQPPKRRRKANP